MSGILKTLKTKINDTEQNVYPKTILEAVVDPETNETLDTILEDIKNNGGGGTGEGVDIIDNLTTADSDAALSANQGKC